MKQGFMTEIGMVNVKMRLIRKYPNIWLRWPSDAYMRQ